MSAPQAAEKTTGSKPLTIAVDFDGTCVTHEFPKLGFDIGAAPVLKELTDKGARIILWTMRSGEPLEVAVGWFKANGVPLFGVNENPEQKSWSQSPKAYAQVYIDDAALGAPLDYDAKLSLRPFIDWAAVRSFFGLETPAVLSKCDGNHGLGKPACVDPDCWLGDENPNVLAALKEGK
jgi:hypothetical protein